LGASAVSLQVWTLYSYSHDFNRFPQKPTQPNSQSITQEDLISGDDKQTNERQTSQQQSK
jgi:hypothetical protein